MKNTQINMEMTSQQTLGDDELYKFLMYCPKEFEPNDKIKKLKLRNGDFIHCVLWNSHFYISGTDIVKILIWRFQHARKEIGAIKKFEEGIFSDLRNLKPGVDATLEGPRSEFLEFLYKNGCIRTQKKQKVFYWYSVPHDELFFDALQRDHRRDNNTRSCNRFIPDTSVNMQMKQDNMNYKTYNYPNSHNSKLDYNNMNYNTNIMEPNMYNNTNKMETVIDNNSNMHNLQHALFTENINHVYKNHNYNIFDTFNDEKCLNPSNPIIFNERNKEYMNGMNRNKEYIGMNGNISRNIEYSGLLGGRNNEYNEINQFTNRRDSYVTNGNIFSETNNKYDNQNMSNERQKIFTDKNIICDNPSGFVNNNPKYGRSNMFSKKFNNFERGTSINNNFERGKNLINSNYDNEMNINFEKSSLINSNYDNEINPMDCNYDKEMNSMNNKLEKGANSMNSSSDNEINSINSNFENPNPMFDDRNNLFDLNFSPKPQEIFTTAINRNSAQIQQKTGNTMQNLSKNIEPFFLNNEVLDNSQISLKAELLKNEIKNFKSDETLDDEKSNNNPIDQTGNHKKDKLNKKMSFEDFELSNFSFLKDRCKTRYGDQNMKSSEDLLNDHFINTNKTFYENEILKKPKRDDNFDNKNEPNFKEIKKTNC